MCKHLLPGVFVVKKIRDRTCTCNVTLWRVRVTIVTMELQRCVLLPLSYIRRCQQKNHLHRNVKCPIFLSDFDEIWIFAADFHESHILTKFPFSQQIFMKATSLTKFGFSQQIVMKATRFWRNLDFRNRFSWKPPDFDEIWIFATDFHESHQSLAKFGFSQQISMKATRFWRNLDFRNRFSWKPPISSVTKFSPATVAMTHPDRRVWQKLIDAFDVMPNGLKFGSWH
jgi:hypothetical protein